jgi:phosphoribosylglycinamide formyltransferase 1
VLASGAGTNLAALIEAARTPGFPARVALVLSNRPSAGALQVARDAGVEARALPVSEFGGDSAARDAGLRDRLLAAGVELLVCAGYDRILGEPLVAAFPDAILNIHPSLLPAFAGGMHAVEDALDHGVKVSGCTVHLIDPGAPDGGPIVLQGACPVLDGDDAESLRQRIHEQEWRLLPEAVALWSSGRLEVHGRRVRVR